MRVRGGARVVDLGPTDGWGTRHEVEMAYESKRREQERIRRLSRKYQTTEAEMAAVIARHTVCAICEKPGKLGVDHDHATGRVRGLLCRSCNLLLGVYEQDPAFFLAFGERAAAYVRD